MKKLSLALACALPVFVGTVANAGGIWCVSHEAYPRIREAVASGDGEAAREAAKRFAEFLDGAIARGNVPAEYEASVKRMAAGAGTIAQAADRYDVRRAFRRCPWLRAAKHPLTKKVLHYCGAFVSQADQIREGLATLSEGFAAFIQVDGSAEQYVVFRCVLSGNVWVQRQDDRFFNPYARSKKRASAIRLRRPVAPQAPERRE